MAHTVDLSDNGPYATGDDSQLAEGLSLTVQHLRQQRALEDYNARFEEIPDYALGEAPETTTLEELAAYRLTTVKRALKAGYEEVTLPDTLTDILADLRHLADHCGVDYEECDQKAHGYYLLERQKGA
jgi:hypothetical protein